MNDDAAKLLWDAVRALDRIIRFTTGADFQSYLADEMLRSAVERQFEIAGEAMAALRRRAPEVAASIAEAPRIIAFRNVLIHSYATVDDRLVWGVIERDLSPLRVRLAVLLGEG